MIGSSKAIPEADLQAMSEWINANKPASHDVYDAKRSRDSGNQFVDRIVKTNRSITTEFRLPC